MTESVHLPGLTSIIRKRIAERGVSLPVFLQHSGFTLEEFEALDHVSGTIDADGLQRIAAEIDMEIDALIMDALRLHHGLDDLPVLAMMQDLCGKLRQIIDADEATH